MTRKKTRNEEYAGGFPPGMEAFEKLSDPRVGRAKRHYFGEVLFIALAAMVSGMDDFEDFERFAEEREDWLRQWLKLPNGTPSDDTFRHLFSALDPEAFGECFIGFTIGNQCHWVMDVTYGEDASRIRSGHAARNVSLLRRLAHNLLKHDQTVKDSIAGKRKRACLSTATLERFLKLGNSK